MNPEKLMTVKEVADFLHVHIQTIYQLIYQKKIPFIKKEGVGYRFRSREVMSWLEQGRYLPEDEDSVFMKRY